MKKTEYFFWHFDKDKVVGFIVGIIEQQTAEELLGANQTKMGRITELYVHHQHRFGGVGSTLIIELENYFKMKKCKFVWVEVFKPNQNAYNFYTKFNYSDRNIEMIKTL